MKLTLTLVPVLAIAALVAPGCKKKDDAGAKAAEPSKPAEPTKPAEPAKPAPPPYTGALTIERVMGAKDALARGPTALLWAEGLARVEALLGKATKIDGDEYQWAVVEGDDCAYFLMEKTDGKDYGAVGEIVGVSQDPIKVAKDGPAMNRRDCLAITGVTAGPPEDPNAAGPPVDGTAVTVEVFRANAIVGRSKWKGQTIKLVGYVRGNSTSKSGDDAWVTLQLTASDKDPVAGVTCTLPTNATTTVKLGDTAVVTGKVELREMMSMGSGETTLEARLSECSAELAPAKGK